jgi:hypothetical protein
MKYALLLKTKNKSMPVTIHRITFKGQCFIKQSDDNTITDGDYIIAYKAYVVHFGNVGASRWFLNGARYNGNPVSGKCYIKNFRTLKM